MVRSDPIIAHVSTCDRRRLLRWRWLATACVGAGLLSPLIILGINGLALNGMTEESTGYRYFYSLRMVYSSERPWVPQGQLPGLFHMAIQVVLTVLGFPPQALHPRIDIFAYAAAALPHVFAAAAFLWMAATIRSRAALLGVAGLVVLVFIPARFVAWGYFLVVPDYTSWVVAVGLITVGWLFRVNSEGQDSKWLSDVRLGLFGGLSLAIKPSYAVFPATIAVLILYRAKPLRRAAALVFGGAIGSVATWVVVVWAYYLGSVSATTAHFHTLRRFVENASNRLVVEEWIASAVRLDSFDATSVAVLLPVALAISVALLPQRALSLSMLIGSLGSVYLACQRFQPQTFPEINAYVLVTLIVWSAGVLGPLISRAGADRARRRFALRAVMPTAAVMVWVLVIAAVARVEATLVPPFADAESGGSRLAQYLASSPGKSLFLIPNNELRLLTVDSAIFKGGTDIYRYFWGASPFVERMFPDRAYMFGATSPRMSPDELWSYSEVVFAAPHGQRQDTIRRLEDTFGLPIRQLQCLCEIEFLDRTVIVCYTRRPPQ